MFLNVSFEQIISTFDGVVFAMLAIVGIVRTYRHRDVASLWFSLTFLLLAVVVVSGLDDDPGLVATRVIVSMLAVVPLCMYRFARSVAPGPTQFDAITLGLTLVVVGWTCAITFPDPGDPVDAPFLAYTIAFIAHWAIMLAVTGWVFVRESRRTAGIARRRLRLFAWSALALAAALVLAGVPADTDLGRVLAVVIQLLGAAAAAGFWFALAPPVILRAWWRSREFSTLQNATTQLLANESVSDVRLRVVELARSLTGARSALLVDEEDGRVLTAVMHDDEDPDRVAAQFGDARDERGRATRQSLIDSTTRDGILRVGRLAVVVGRATPFFGTEERRLLEMLDGIERLVEERANVLDREREAMRKLRDIDELKTEFVAMVAHDLRSPMTVIAGFADTIAQRWDEFDDARKLEFLGLISRNAHSLAGFVEDVLHVARIDSGALAYEVVPFDARGVVTRVLDEVRLTRPDLELQLEIPDDVPRALGDAERHWQILSNLVGNAIKYTTAEHPRVTVNIGVLSDGRELAIAITDNGIGIAEEDQSRLFRRFSRVGASRAQFEGTGLGLYIVKSMVEAQGGRIWVASEPGQGSTFTYTVPVAEPV